MASDRLKFSRRGGAFATLLLILLLTTDVGAALVGVGQLRGYTVYGSDGMPAGEVMDLLIDLRQGRIGYLLVASTGKDSRTIAIPWRAVRIQVEPPSARLAIPAEKLHLAPTMENAPTDSQKEQSIHQFFGVAPYWEGDSAFLPPSPPRNLRINP